MPKTISLLVENRPGALARVVELFSARGHNIERLTVGPTADPTLSEMQIVVELEGEPLEKIIRQLNKLIDVISAALADSEGRCGGEDGQDLLRPGC